MKNTNSSSSGTVRATDENIEEKAERLERFPLREGPFFVLINSLLLCGTSKNPKEAAPRWAATVAQLLLRNASQTRTDLSATDAVVRAQELLRSVDVRALEQWPGASGPPDFANCDSVIFPIMSETAITEDYFVHMDTTPVEV